MKFAELPDDMKMLLFQLVEDFHVPPEDVNDDAAWPDLVLEERLVARLYKQARTWGLDPNDRGRDHVDQMKQDLEGFPPIVVRGHMLVDGRHRLYALHECGVEFVQALDLNVWLLNFKECVR